MHYAIVEDRTEDQEYLLGLIREEHRKLGIPADFSCYPNGEVFLKEFIPGTFQAVFLDIMLEKNGLNGMETARRLRCLSKRIPIIFTTSELEFALEGYEVHPLDYLLKPVEPDKLAWCLQEIREHLAVPSCITIPVTSGQGAAPVNRPLSLDDIVYVEKSGHCLLVHSMKDDIRTRMSFSDLLALLPKSGSFYLNSKTLLVNFSQVQAISEDGKILFKNGESLFCSRRTKKETQDAYFSYVFHNLRKDGSF
ncbi:DNA-binding response regulator [Clostridium sp. OM02-18AC]|uniref:LytR/AlgR family response regulator transcription factor n=1 Tax=Clostridium sp. OM02-18AC TaxID=2292311 RepID=UPI000E4C7F7C|nr:LytTR family DNA-binding domain-containing protein [Clostridium sp. OM02-18AC]RHV69871.1 DNA-binding response regulator [Clostridium sp. OM02-18AC]